VCKETESVQILERLSSCNEHFCHGTKLLVSSLGSEVMSLLSTFYVLHRLKQLPVGSQVLSKYLCPPVLHLRLSGTRQKPKHNFLWH